MDAGKFAYREIFSPVDDGSGSCDAFKNPNIYKALSNVDRAFFVFSIPASTGA